MPRKTIGHYVGDDCKAREDSGLLDGHWLEHRNPYDTDLEHFERSFAHLKYPCGFCHNGNGPSGTIGMIGRDPFTYICLTCISKRVLGEEFSQWVTNVPYREARDAGALGVALELAPPQVRIRSASGGKHA